MAIIKTFQGTGPNPNVPFAGDVPRPQFIGQVESSVDKLAGDIEKAAVNYMQFQKNQTDTANIAELDAAKMVYQAELDGREDLREANGNINLDSYRREMAKFYDTAKVNMSKESYAQWSAKQTVQDGRRFANIISDNMKNTRQANAVRFSQSVETMASNSLTGSFEDMQNAMVDIKTSLDNGVSSGIITLAEAIEYEDKVFKKTSKSYIDTLTDTPSFNQAEINSNFDQAIEFVKADPYGIYTRDQGLRDSALLDIASKRLGATQKAQNNLFQMDNIRERNIKHNQERNYRTYQAAIVEYNAKPIADRTPREYEQILANIMDEVTAGNLSSSQASDLLNSNQRSMQYKSESFSEAAIMYANEGEMDKANEFINRIPHASVQKSTWDAINTVPYDVSPAMMEVQKYNKSLSGQIRNKFVSLYPAFEDITDKYPDENYTIDDFKQLFLEEYGDRYSQKYFTDITSYNMKMKTVLDAKGGNVDPDAVANRLRTLSKRLNFNKK